MAQGKNKLKVIGRLEHIDFPDWGLSEIEAKIDTGAYTSSLHCHHIKRIEENGEELVTFHLLDPSHEIYEDKLFKLPIHRKKTVKSSNGSTEERYVIQTNIRIFDVTFTARFSLTDRSEMRYPVLLGRKLLNSRFLVDVSQKHLSTKNHK
ncbi:hypothetical protein LX73_0531 [Fodinibius salinus]|uniref:Retropepsin-like aspartic endopeptidase domain-containing protein n=1 Tax=Fodinibius salinus TaxID=860790 RepID=A0A5D3YMY7_9BACT|nr:RimK/LysX family protein [Fodinibius salinus]TYP95234.1 hypothetical protein LX73_0531 [Fodinibius salinus]